MNYGAIVSLVIVFCASYASDCCQLAVKTLSNRASSGSPLIVASRCAGTIASKALCRGAKEVIKHPCICSLCAAGVLISVPSVRSAVVNAGCRGAAKIGLSAVGFILQPISSYFLGDINNGLERANSVLDDHAGRLETIQNGVQAVEKQIENMANDVTAVKSRIDESYKVLQSLEQIGQKQSHELADVKNGCDQMGRSLDDVQGQLEELKTSMHALDMKDQEKMEQYFAEIQQLITEQQGVLNLQFASVQSDLIKLTGVPDKLTILEQRQALQCEQLTVLIEQLSGLCRLFDGKRMHHASNAHQKSLEESEGKGKH